MTNNDPEYVAQLERALEAAELEIKGLEEQIRKQDKMQEQLERALEAAELEIKGLEGELREQDKILAEMQEQLAPTRMGEPMIYSAAHLAAAHAEGRAAGLREALNAIDNIDEPTSYGYEPKYLFPDGIRASADAIEKLLEKL